jgi:pimeloyl-ACP methyl ester carboxylesterase
LSSQSIYKSPEGKDRILALYDGFLNKLDVAYEDRTVHTRFGATHVLVFGPEHAPPVVITHGGNSINPQGLRCLLPILRENCYRIYAPDTIGHPGKSAQTRLSPKDQSYGQWLADVLDGLGLESAAFVGGSYGAGIILRLAAFAPSRITKMALFVPSGIVGVPLHSMMWRIGLPFTLYLLFPNQKRLVQAVRWMGDEIEEDVLELVKTVFEQVKVEAEMPRPATKTELLGFHAPTLIVAAEKDAMFPGDAVIQRGREIIPNLVAAECLKGGTHYSSRQDMATIIQRIREFIP